MITAIYCRVSTEEQMKGMSIMAQKQALTEFCKENGHAIYDYYIDDGISADKLNKRLQLQRLLTDIKNHKVELVIFTKIDRWFRSVEKYYKIQPILEENNVVWKAIYEDYSTVDANSRFKLNIMLSVAQQERERTSERVKDVFSYMAKNKIAVMTKCPYGFKIEKINGVRKLVIDEDKREIAKDLISYYRTSRNMRQTVDYINSKYNESISYRTAFTLTHSPLVYGHYRDIDGYCEALITKEEFEDMQMTHREYFPRNKKVYLFSYLIKCPDCGHMMVGTQGSTPQGAKRYRCSFRNLSSRNREICHQTHTINENRLEEELLTKINAFMQDYIIEVEEKEKQEKPKIDEDKIRQKMERLTDVYIMGNISKQEYERKYSELKMKLDSKPVEESSEKIKELVDTDFLSLYETLNREEKRMFWHGLLKEIKIDSECNVKEVVFL